MEHSIDFNSDLNTLNNILTIIIINDRVMLDSKILLLNITLYYFTNTGQNGDEIIKITTKTDRYLCILHKYTTIDI